MFKKITLLLICLLFSFSFAYAEEYSPENGMVELRAIYAAEEDFDGVWVPMLQYLRRLTALVTPHEAYKNDFLIIIHGNISIALMDRFYTDLPYKYENGKVLSAIPVRDEEPIYITLRLLDENLMLYSRFFDGEVKNEFICKRVEYSEEN